MFLQFFRSFARKFGCKREVKFLRRLKEAHLQFLYSKNLKILKTGCVRKQLQICQFSIPATLFTGKVQQCVKKKLETVICINFI